MTATEPGLAAEAADIETLVSCVRRLVGRQALDDIHVIGHSRGGQVALRLAIALPDRARGVVLTGSAGLGEQSLVGSLVSLG